MTAGTIDKTKAQAAYDLILDALMVSDLNRAEAATGLLTVLATHYNGGTLEPEHMRTFTKQAHEWLSAYFREKQ